MKKNTLFVKAVICDMDGVITATMPYHYRAWKKILRKEGFDLRRYDIYKREGQRGIDSLAEIFTAFGKKCPAAKARRLLREKEKIFNATVRIRYVPGIRSFIKSLNRKGIALAIVTGTSRQECEKILPGNFRSLFTAIITANDIAQGKPDPAPYRLALRRLRCRPSEALVIENAPLGIRSAKSAGCRCFALATSLPEEYLRTADRIFDSVKRLKMRFDFVPLIAP